MAGRIGNIIRHGFPTNKEVVNELDNLISKRVKQERKESEAASSDAYLTDAEHTALAGDHVTNGDTHDHSGGDGAQVDHGGLGGLTDDDHAGYALLAGRASGQTLEGGVAASETLTITSTHHGTKGDVIIGGDGSANCTAVESDGTLEFRGTAMVWEDLRIEPVARTTGANAPTFEKYFDDSGGTSRGVYLYSFDDAVGGSEKEVFFTMQMPHSWAGTSISFHVHWVPSVADTTATPRWGLEYCWVDIGGTYGDTTIVYATGNTASDTDLTQYKHYITEFADLAPGAGADGISSVLIGRLFRDSANAADTYDQATNKCGLLYIDAHYEVDTIGSRTEYVK